MSKVAAATPVLESFTLEQPSKEDGQGMWNLAKKSSLDLNSAYKYIMMAEYFSETCVVAKERGEVVGFITGFIQPEHPDVVFVWQVGVDSSQRGKGVGYKMLEELVNRDVTKDVKYLEATITKDNTASQSLFKKLSKEYETSFEVRETFPADVFPEDGDAEYTYRIGPLKK
ncbi:diaminobutyrate acetyltransferase [Alkalicoccus halolimnae]|jgi:L-2,4-diaminobutyric acid acetyltransferase|uniref:L-2,4-diaminobutyric acid acetyltransferase n=1 Tax=Alkalicoccus halolimnae TaxID=1667239 RepID=A0A5C7F802_9BACI|nr:diaminobutyrate acetyltransferase [Alkalicoccus halolimnae]TXF86801.1 diaminobutyrate acetyltransferase [Alkalicoccus halolimnae]